MLDELFQFRIRYTSSCLVKTVLEIIEDNEKTSLVQYPYKRSGFNIHGNRLIKNLVKMRDSCHVQESVQSIENIFRFCCCIAPHPEYSVKIQIHLECKTGSKHGLSNSSEAVDDSGSFDIRHEPFL